MIRWPAAGADAVMAALGRDYRSATGIDAEMFATRAAARVLPS